ncbi:putative photosynthetic complex assembly protein PuhE [Methylobacterium sp. R2-1]|uniref:putative photosynthetic complex assembly protein PuhE n=1 Tax=Methylobacterium sp. R2-1 TaxID=2587064 RepID=UPI00160FA063|nr:putative photosynthetic complex assembly protein PuhE [Methylobacterium sp. R2-1]MBB2961240.1 putative photosynthetic complex assembly protein 2 [Methylobacterium sp. R2-1]
MGTYAAPALYAVLLWWSATGLVLVLQHLPRRTHARSMVAASAVLAGALWAIGAVADDDTETGAYIGFTAAVIVWGWQEMTYYMGFVSGPKPAACAPNLRGLDRFFAALATSLWHEFAILLGGLAILCLTWGAGNRVALGTYALLALMNASARLNLFLGVRNLHAEFLPQHLGYLACYLSRRRMNPLFPVSVTLGTAATVRLARGALGAEATPQTVTGLSLLAALAALATLEHWFLMLPLPSAALWNWSLPGRSAPVVAEAQDTAAGPRE